jgi:integrase
MTNFQLPKTKSGRATIVATKWESGKRIRYSTGIKIEAADWDSRLQRSKSDTEINTQLEAIRNGKPLAVSAPNAMPKTLYDAIKNHRPDTEVKSTARGYNTTKNTIKEQFPNEPFPPTRDFARRFAFRLTDLGKAKSTIRSRMSKLQKMLSVLDVKLEAKPRIVVPTSEFEYLNLDQIAMLQTATLPDNKLHNARQLFLIMAATGQRYSDLHKILAHRKTQYTYLQFRQAKEKHDVIIPASETTRQLIEEARIISNQKLNKYLKEIATLLEFPAITCHTARRSFATNAILAGISSTEVMRIGGWRSVAVFQKYIRVTEIQIAQRLASHQFFQ